MKSWKFEQRVLFVALLPGATIALVLSIYFLALRYADVDAALASRGATLARQLAPASEYGAFSGNVLELRRLAVAAAREADVSGIIFYDRDNNPIAIAGSPRYRDNPGGLPDGWSGATPDGQTLLFHAKILPPTLPMDDLPAAAPGVAPPLGSLMVEMSRAVVTARKQEILAVTSGFTLLLLAIAGLLARRLEHDVSDPVLALEKAVADIRAGNLAARVVPHPAGTLVSLERDINSMAAALEEARRIADKALATSEAELQRQTDLAETLLKAQSDAGIGIAIHVDGRVTYANQAYCRMHSKTHEEVLAVDHVAELLHPSVQMVARETLDKLARGDIPAGRRESMVLTPEGETRFHEVMLCRMPPENGKQPILAVVTDNTEHRRDERLLAEAYARLQEQKEEAERASQAKSRFLAAASHDLRQPLHALSLFAGELETKVEKPKQQKLVNQIMVAASAMGELLEALLDISRLDLAGLAPERRAIPVQPLLEKLVETHQGAATAKGLTLHAVPTRLWIETDPVLIERILGNLISNAVRYTRRGGVVVGVRREGDNARLEVWDSGMGIATEHLPLIFQEFYQVGNPERDAGKGLGLGLSIVERLAKALGHLLRARSEPGRGSVFAITVPRAEAQNLDPGLEDGQVNDDSARILVVHEKGAIADSLCELMRGWGYRVGSAHSLPDLERVLEQPPDLAVVDDCCIAPTGDVLSQLTAPPLVIILGDMVASPAVPVAGHLPKPIQPAKLRALLRHLLERRQEEVV
ncbi:MAG: PAS domain S-box protein [Rhodocyclaceae bacterium]|nr:PAS domain S-box protein [Rhodocyclaceae bacterium]